MNGSNERLYSLKRVSTEFMKNSKKMDMKIGTMVGWSAVKWSAADTLYFCNHLYGIIETYRLHGDTKEN